MDQSIRYLYSGYTADIPPRNNSGTSSGIIDLHDRVLEKYKYPLNRFEGKFQEYVPTYHTRLPRAPALRAVSAHEVQQITDRLYRSLSRQPEQTADKPTKTPRGGQAKTPRGGPTKTPRGGPTKTPRVGPARQEDSKTFKSKKHPSEIEKIESKKKIKATETNVSWSLSQTFQSESHNDQPQNLQSDSFNSQSDSHNDRPQNLQSDSFNSQSDSHNDRPQNLQSDSFNSQSDSHNDQPQNLQSDSFNSQSDSHNDRPQNLQSDSFNGQSDSHNDQPQNLHIQAIAESKMHIPAIAESKMHIPATAESKMHIPAAESHHLDPDPFRCGGVPLSSSPETFPNGTCQHVQEDVNEAADSNAQSLCENTDTISIQPKTSAEMQRERDAEGKATHGRWSSSGNKSTGFGDMNFLKEIMDIKIDEPNHVTRSIFSPINDQVSQRQNRPDGLTLSPLRHKAVLKLHNAKHHPRAHVNTLSKSETVDPLALHIEQTNLWTQPSLTTKLPWQHNKQILKDDMTASPERRLVSWRRKGTQRRDPAEPCQLPYRYRDPAEPCQLPYRHRRTHKSLKQSNVRHPSFSKSVSKDHDFPRGRDDLFCDNSSLSDNDIEDNEDVCQSVSNTAKGSQHRHNR